VSRTSAGILLYRLTSGAPEVFLVHPGGPFWAHRDAGAWSIPKGEFSPPEDGLAAARREFAEETGFSLQGEFRQLEPVKQPGGKVVHAWAVEGDCDPDAIESNTFTIEWPPKSGRQARFPEVDRAVWFAMPDAGERILRGQRPLLEQLAGLLRRP
jgi:predicted NUDIX family NTP pyrophosphohydrolase